MVDEQKTTWADRLLALDMSAPYGIIAGLVLWMQLTPYLARLHAGFAGIVIGALVCGLIANRHGWLVGTVLGVLAFGMGLHTLLSLLAPEQASATAEAARRTLLWHTIGLQALWIPLAAVGGFVGGLARGFLARKK